MLLKFHTNCILIVARDLNQICCLIFFLRIDFRALLCDYDELVAYLICRSKKSGVPDLIVCFCNWAGK